MFVEMGVEYEQSRQRYITRDPLLDKSIFTEVYNADREVSKKRIKTENIRKIAN